MFQRCFNICVLMGLLLVAGSGCMLRKDRVRTPLQRKSFQSVERGVTTIDEVGEKLGAPNQIVWSNGVTNYMNADQNIGFNNTFTTKSEDLWVRAYLYEYKVIKTSMFPLILLTMYSTDTKYDDGIIFFDKSGKVETVGFSGNSKHVSYNPFK